MKVISFFFFVGFLGLQNLVFAQKETKNFAVKDFTSVDVRVAASVFLSKGDTFKCRVEGRERHVNKIDISVKNNELIVRALKEDFWDFNEREVSIFIEMPNLEGLDFSGAGSITSKSDWSGEKIKVALSGAGNIELSNIDYKNLKADMSGAGNMTLSGKATEIDMDMSGAGNIDALHLAAEKGNCDVSGVGRISCDVRDDLQAHVSGIGGVRYKNKPTNLSKHVSGIGKVKAY
jgi:Putative auto-transporter adhesin, head GIN domain